MDGKAKLFLEVAGGNAGSIHAVSFVFPNLEKFLCAFANSFFLFPFQTCDANSALQKLNGPDKFQSEGSSTLQYNLYDIHNPSQYLKGEDAIAVEKGPYKLK